MADFLLELRSEEIPARMQAGARAELTKLFRAQMHSAGVAVGDVSAWSTPRRLALIARGLPQSTEAVSEEAKGPPVGAPDQAVEGFCRKNGVTRETLEVRDVKGRETYFAVKDIPGRETVTLLAEAIPTIIREFSWPKSMRWGDASVSTESLRWVRPLSGIVALLDGEVVPCVMDGLATGRETMGHRFHSNGVISVDGADDYADKLRAAFVIVDQDERQDMIREGAAKVAAEAGLTLVEDEGLVIENAGLTEWPVPLLGRFDESYLDVPPEVIQLTARVNQKYFVCEDKDGKLANAFVCTANIAAQDPAVVVDGNRKVLAARLSDARFFWELDQKKTLAEHAKGLERITFHEKLGAVADKVDRVAKLARWLCEEGIVKGDPDLAEQAARLCKADLVTEMVGEFPELQGLMGGYYAEREGQPQEVSDAIRDHYKPVGQGDDVPTAPVTVAVSLADKLDTIVSFFLVNEKPTGSKDPFALRRAAIGVISQLLDSKLRVELANLILTAAANLHEQAISRFDQADVAHAAAILDVASLKYEADSGEFARQIEPVFKAFRLAGAQGVGKAAGSARKNANQAVAADMAEIVVFFFDRLVVQQKGNGTSASLIHAVFDLVDDTDLVRLLARVKALQSFVETDNGTNLLAGYKRSANILKKEEWAGEGGATDLSYSPEAAEKALIDALDAAEPKAAQAIEAEDFEAAMSALASLREPIDQFFEEVTVNDPDKDKRSARLDLLARFRNAVHRVADFSRIEG